jgi:hypothetical protein
VSDSWRPPGLTRRSVLGSGVAVGAASLLAPAASLAAAIDRRRPARRWIGTLDGESGEISAPQRFALVGVEWLSPARAVIELRTRARGAAWSRWVTASIQGHDPDVRAGPVKLFGEPVWSGQADFVQLRSSQSLRGVLVHFVSAAAGGSPSASAAGLPLAQPVLDAGPGQPPIIARNAWARGQAPPAVPASYGAVKLAFVHHTDGSNGYSAPEVPAMLLAIFDYHRYVRGYNDIAYNFLIDAMGRIWEGRAGGVDEPVIGAHAGGYNFVSTGVAVLGTFMDVVPPRPAVQALERLLAWKLSLHGVPTQGRVTVEVDPAAAFYTPFKPGAHVSLPRIAGHRDGDLTDCPGNAFYARLPSIRPVVGGLAGSPAALTLAAASGVLDAGATAQLSGSLALLAGAPLAGAPLELQQLKPGTGTATTVATFATGPDGSWSASLPLSANARLRVLHRVAPAAVSDVAAIGVAPVLTLSLESQSPVRVAGTVSPGKRAVRVDVYELSGRHRRLLASTRVLPTSGRFSQKLGLKRAGRYTAVARTRADAQNLAGASAPLVITV